jgi:hypothetical protein
MPESGQPPEIKRLASDDKKKEVRVVILTYSNDVETRPELIGSDRQLSELLYKQLHELCESNQEKVAIIPPRKVEEFKSSHPDWQKQELATIGRYFRADYVIYLEINSLGLYEKGSANQLYRGNADLVVTLVDVNKPDEAPEQKQFSCVYPSDAKGPVPVGLDTQPMLFRQAFLTFIAKRLSWFFSPYPKRESYYVE